MHRLEPSTSRADPHASSARPAGAHHAAREQPEYLPRGCSARGRSDLAIMRRPPVSTPSSNGLNCAAPGLHLGTRPEHDRRRLGPRVSAQLFHISRAVDSALRPPCTGGYGRVRHGPRAPLVSRTSNHRPPRRLPSVYARAGMTPGDRSGLRTARARLAGRAGPALTWLQYARARNRTG